MNQNTSKKIYIYSLVMALFLAQYHFNVSSAGFVVRQSSGWDELFFSFFGRCVNLLGGGIGLGYFFVSSAFLFYFNVSNDNINEKLKRRVYTLIIPYFAWNVLAFLYEIVLARRIPEYMGGMYYIRRIIFEPWDGPLWFIVALLLYLCFSPLVIKLKGHRALGITILVVMYAMAFWYCGLGNYKNVTILTGWIERFVRYIPVYFTGAFVALNHKEIVLKEDGKMYSVGAMAFLLLSLAYLWGGINWLTWISFEIVPVLVWFVIRADRFQFFEIKPRHKISFLIFAIHQEFVWRLWSLVAAKVTGGTGISVNGWIGIIVWILCIPIIYLITYIVAMVLANFPRANRILTGNR